MEKVLDRLKELKNILKDDRKSLLENLSKQAGQLLKKIDRCFTLLKICDQCIEFEFEFENFTYKFVDQIISLLSQISPIEPSKLEISCSVLEIILERRNLRGNNEGDLYKYLENAISMTEDNNNYNNNHILQLKLKFYTIKFKRDQYIMNENENENVYGDNSDNENVNRDNDNEILIDTLINNNIVNVQDHSISISNSKFDDDDLKITNEDLQKLKIFETFPV